LYKHKEQHKQSNMQATMTEIDAARKLLADDLPTGLIPLEGIEMGPEDVYHSRPQFADLPYKSFKKYLLYLRKKEGDWATSKARKLLAEDLTTGLIPLDGTEMGPLVVYEQRPEFVQFPHKNFRTNLLNLRKDITAKKALAVSESAALANDRRIHPKRVLNPRGEPRWEGSEIVRLLRLDMDVGKHHTMKPLELRQTRQQYRNYPKSV
jgi:hypothetical protein